MGWSTKQLADLAVTTVRAIRHYHQVGVLPEPQRSANGYKQYQIEHLVRVLQIKRLTSIGMTLVQAGEALQDPKHGLEMLQNLEDELDLQIAKLRAAKAEVGAAKAMGLRPDMPTTLVDLGYDQLDATDGESQLMFLMSELGDLSAIDMSEINEDLALGRLEEEFRCLPADASKEDCESLKNTLLKALDPYTQSVLASNVVDSKNEEQVDFLVDLAIDAYLNEAQACVIREVSRELTKSHK